MYAEIYVYTYMYVCIYIYIYTYIHRYSIALYYIIVQYNTRRAPLGATYRTPEIKTSETIVDFRWHLPTDFQWQFPMDVHFCDFWCVVVCPAPWRSRTRRPRGGFSF